jgi:hypothetical protein
MWISATRAVAPRNTRCTPQFARLRVGDALDLVERDLRDGAGRVVVRLAKGDALPDRTLAGVKVSAVVVRKAQVPEDRIQARPKVEKWETVLCDLTFE